MNENKILNETLKLVDKEGIVEAYNFLIEKKNSLNNISGQYYNFLYCLAALSGNNESALTS